jgi:hypothetical protein
LGTYGISLYGLSKYGTDKSHPEFDVSPFTATPADYETVLLDWTSPAGTWDTLRLLRNRYGWAVNENDGEILLDQTTKSTSFIDKGVVGGHWLYYTIFISASGQWSRAGTVSCLMPKDNGYTDLLYSLVPSTTRSTPPQATTSPTTPTPSTRTSTVPVDLRVRLRHGEELLRLQPVHQRRDAHALRQHRPVGHPVRHPVRGIHPAYLFRQRVRDAATLGRQKGTLEQIRSIISETTGYDADLSVSATTSCSPTTRPTSTTPASRSGTRA